MNKSQTIEVLKSFISGAQTGQNVGALAAMINLTGDWEIMREVIEVKGFRDLLKAALPDSQHKIGWLAN